MLKFAPQQAYLIFWESFIIFYIPKWDSFFLFYSLLLLALYQVWSRHQTVDDQNNVYFKKGSFWDLIIYSKLESDGLTIFFFISIDPPDERITYVALKFQMMVNSLRIFFPVSLLFMSLACDWSTISAPSVYKNLRGFISKILTFDPPIPDPTYSIIY